MTISFGQKHSLIVSEIRSEIESSLVGRSLVLLRLTDLTRVEVNVVPVGPVTDNLIAMLGEAVETDNLRSLLAKYDPTISFVSVLFVDDEIGLNLAFFKGVTEEQVAAEALRLGAEDDHIYAVATESGVTAGE